MWEAASVAWEILNHKIAGTVPLWMGARDLLTDQLLQRIQKRSETSPSAKLGIPYKSRLAFTGIDV